MLPSFVVLLLVLLLEEEPVAVVVVVAVAVAIAIALLLLLLFFFFLPLLSSSLEEGPEGEPMPPRQSSLLVPSVPWRGSAFPYIFFWGGCC